MRRFAVGRFVAVCAMCVVALASGSAAGQTQLAPKRHQATGTIATSGPAQLVLLKTFGRNQARWNFVLNPKTKLEGKLTKGERVRIYYYNDAKGERVAEEIKALAASPAATKISPAPTAAPAPPQASH